MHGDLLRYRDELTRFAMRLCGDDHASAPDLVQDTFLKAISRASLFKPGTNKRAWLFRILKNTFINEYRQGVRHRELRDENTDMIVTKAMAHDPYEAPFNVRSINPSDVVALGLEAGGLFSEDVVNALWDLPEDWLGILILVALYDLSYKEVADIYNIPIGTVMSRLSRARTRLRENPDLIEYALSEKLVSDPEEALV